MGRRLAFLGKEHGSVTVFFIGMLPAFIVLAGFAVDAANAFSWRTALQATADAAAHAAVMELPDIAKASSTAVSYSTLNVPVARGGEVLKAADVETGNWNGATRVFTPNGTPLDAVRVTARRAAVNSNALPTFFLTLVGVDSFDIVVTAVAEAGENPCMQNGFVANTRVESGSSTHYRSNFCVHGQGGVRMGSSNVFDPGTQVSMPDLELLDTGSNNSGLTDALLQKSLVPPLPQQVEGLIDGFRTGQRLPSFITQTQQVQNFPLNPVPGTLYIVQNQTTIGSSRTLENVGIVSTKEIGFGSSITLRNVLVASSEDVTFGSSLRLGATDFCSTLTGGVYIFSAKDVQMGSGGSGNNFAGVQIVAKQDVALGSSLASVNGLAVQAGRRITYGSANNFSECPVNTIIVTATKILHLVD